MSQENIEIVRFGYERLNDADIDGLLQLCSPNLEFRDLPALPGSGMFIGHDGFRAWWAQVVDAFEDLRFEAEELIDAGGDRVVVVNHGIGRGRGSGADVEMHFSSVWTLSDGKVARIIVCDDHAQALEAAGLGA